MSYARFGWDGSDVYVFLNSDKLECCACHITETIKYDPPIINFFGQQVDEATQSYFAATPADMIAHLRQHVNAGDTVPEYVFTKIVEDFPELDKPIPEDFKY